MKTMVRSYPKPTKAQLKTAVFATIYANGVVLMKHEKADPDAGVVDFYTVWQVDIQIRKAWGGDLTDYCVTVRRDQIGMIWKLTGIEVTLDNWSENSRAKGLIVNTVEFCFDGFRIPVHTLPNCITGDITLDCTNEALPDYDKVMSDGYWGSGYVRIANFKLNH